MKTITTVSEFNSTGNLVKTTVTEVVEDKNENEAVETEPFRMVFNYHGSKRVVERPQFIPGALASQTGIHNTLLGGFEVSSGGVATGRYKNYNVLDIRYV